VAATRAVVAPIRAIFTTCQDVMAAKRP
jgi:hypothetical protein